MAVHKTKYNFGDLVYLKTDPEQLPRMVVSFWLRPGTVMYELGCGDKSSDHYEIEISGNSDILKKVM